LDSHFFLDFFKGGTEVCEGLLWEFLEDPSVLVSKSIEDQGFDEQDFFLGIFQSIHSNLVTLRNWNKFEEHFNTFFGCLQNDFENL
jgi:hypothetical protein